MHRLPLGVVAPRIIATICLVARLDRLAFFELPVCRPHLTPHFPEVSPNPPHRPPAQSPLHAMFRERTCPPATAWAAGEVVGLREDCRVRGSIDTAETRPYLAFLRTFRTSEAPGGRSRGRQGSSRRRLDHLVQALILSDSSHTRFNAWTASIMVEPSAVYLVVFFPASKHLANATHGRPNGFRYAVIDHLPCVS